VVLLEGELAAIKDEDRQRTRLLGDMAAQRDRWGAQHSQLLGDIVAGSERLLPVSPYVQSPVVMHSSQNLMTYSGGCK
jgi:hypothetical protein